MNLCTKLSHTAVSAVHTCLSCSYKWRKKKEQQNICPLVKTTTLFKIRLHFHDVCSYDSASEQTLLKCSQNSQDSSLCHTKENSSTMLFFA